MEPAGFRITMTFEFVITTFKLVITTFELVVIWKPIGTEVHMANSSL